MRAAIYARVSTERQERQQTIGSQVFALRGWAAAAGHVLAEAHVFQDEGYSGSRLDRPALDALRDAVRDAAVDVVAVFSPDRLARKYAYQVLLMEEFRRIGCEVVFLHHPISDDPNDQLLLQIQGAIAEYERAVLAERFRRGKLQKAREGHIISSKVPYGYRYAARNGAVPARLVVDEAEAAMVRQLYSWVLQDGLTIRQCMKRLNAGPWVTRSGRKQWSSSVVHHILTDPVYVGTAYANRFEYAVPRQPRRRSRRGAERTSRRPRPPEQWIAIPAPPLIAQRTSDAVAAALARNAQLSFRRNKKHDYMLRCLLKCGRCGLGIHGCYFPGHGGRAGRRYYRCAGTDALTTARAAKCPRARIEAEPLEQAVWAHVAGLLRDPAQLRAQFERFLAEAEGAGAEDAAGLKLRARLDRLDRADQRLLEAYQAEVISLDELSGQRRALAEQRHLAEQQHERLLRLRDQRLQAREALASLAAFSEHVGDRLDTAGPGERQAILRLVIERIIVHDDTLEIQHVIPLRGQPPGHQLNHPDEGGLRSDCVRHAGSLDHAAVIQPGEAGIAVGLQDATERAQMRPRMLALAVRRVAVEHRRRCGAGEGTIVPHIGPQPRRACPPQAGFQHRHHGIIGMHPLAGHHMPRQGVHQGADQPRHLPHHVGQGRARQIDVRAGVDLGLAMQRQMVAVFRHQHVRQQPGTGASARHRQAGRRRLGDRLAGPAGQFRPLMPDHPERTRHVVEDLGHVGAERAQRAAAGRADAGGGMRDHRARQRLRQRPTGRPGRLLRRRFGRRSGAARRRRVGQQFVDIGEGQFELLDPLAQLLRRAAEGHAQGAGEPGPQRLDLVALLDQPGAGRGQFRLLGITFGQRLGQARLLRGDLGRLRRDQGAQRGDIVGQVAGMRAGGIGRHARRFAHAAASRQAKQAWLSRPDRV